MSDSIARLTAHLQALVGERHPETSPAALRQAEQYLRDQFTALGFEVAAHEFEAPGGTYRNVIATCLPLTASVRSKPPLILAAHFDTVTGSPGADDNASGLAVLLEVARRLREIPLGRPVRFIAFNLEEQDPSAGRQGLLGSLAYAAHLRATGQTVLGAIVLECVGYARFEEGTQQIPPGVPIAVPSTGNFLGVVGNVASASLIDAVEKAAQAHVPVISLEVPGNGELLPDTRRSDHAAFWHHGYPAVMLTDTADFRNPHYHQPTDTIATVNLNFMAKVLEGVTAATKTLAEAKGPA
ncbi:MAG TPA: M28 family peptidase [Nitrospiraceae bacterium]|jgi:Zn-dependent M28 family amino/carboxypeptidase|nr:M28 family peptidase [Nitrospiraceae bacterium]